ncbi:MAG: hypothetical protein JWO98_1454, partial [Frankiales bacterium]|nr:hypothetical protein [Frankiales bacterium]
MELTPWEAMALAGVLATTAAKADSDGETIIRTMDL